MGKGHPHANSRGDLAGLKNVTIPISGSMDITGVAATVDAGTFVLSDLPQGNILLLGAVANVIVSAVDADVLIDWLGDYGIGTIPNADVDLGDAGDDNIIASTTCDADTGLKVSLSTRGASTQTEHSIILDNTDGSLELNFNLLVDDNFITDAAVGTFTVTGNLFLCYAILGDD